MLAEFLLSILAIKHTSGMTYEMEQSGMLNKYIKIRHRQNLSVIANLVVISIVFLISVSCFPILGPIL